MIKINENNLSKVNEFINIRDKVIKGQEQAVAESEKVVIKLLKSSIKAIKILATSDFYQKHQTLLNELPYTPQMYLADSEILKSIVGYKHHSGIMALVERPKAVTIESMQGPIVVLNGVSSPENVGCIVRTMLGFGIKNIIIDEKATDPLIRRCIRVSMGNVFNANIHYTKNLKESLKSLRQNKRRLIATSAQRGSTPLHEFEFKNEDVIIFGSEGHGVFPEVLELTDHSLFIPIDQTVHSFNVATAAGIILYKLSREL